MARKEPKKYSLKCVNGEWLLQRFDTDPNTIATLHVTAELPTVLEYLERQGIHKKEIIYDKPTKPEKDSGAWKGPIEESPLFKEVMKPK